MSQDELRVKALELAAQMHPRCTAATIEQAAARNLRFFMFGYFDKAEDKPSAEEG